MIEGMESGWRVWHVAYGGGVVESLVAGRRVRVRFDGARDLPRTLLRAELRVDGALPATAPKPVKPPKPPKPVKPVKPVKLPKPKLIKAPKPKPVNAPKPVKPMVRTRPARPESAQPRPPSPRRNGRVAAIPRPERATVPVPIASPAEVADIRQTLEALRLGVVPSRFVADYTVGRDAELKDLGALLDDGCGFRAVWGDYGAGKTHLLDVAEHRARERGFATARVVLDPLEVPPTHPKRLYEVIVQSLRLPDSADVGLDPLAFALCESQEHRSRAGPSFSPFLSPYLHALHEHDEQSIGLLRDYVHGEPVDTHIVNAELHRLRWTGPRVLTMSDYRTYGRMYLHLIGTLAVWVRDAGCRGLVLLFDEVEYIDALTCVEQAYALEVLKHFAAVTVPEVWRGFDVEGLYRGGHEIHRRIPLRFRDDQPLAVVFALTPLEEVREIYDEIVLGGRLAIDLGPLRRAHRTELIEKVEALYRRGYPGFECAAEDRRRAQKRILAEFDDDPSTVRRIVQRTVLVLDEQRYGETLAHGA